MDRQSFSLLHDAPLTSEGSLAAWCPTMDICAVVTADGPLHLHRLNWQTLWVTSPEWLVSALAWRPDGKLLAAGAVHAGCFVGATRAQLVCWQPASTAGSICLLLKQIAISKLHRNDDFPCVLLTSMAVNGAPPCNTSR